MIDGEVCTYYLLLLLDRRVPDPVIKVFWGGNLFETFVRGVPPFFTLCVGSSI